MSDAITAQALKDAIALAQQGRLNDAITIAEQALTNGGDVVALNAFLGMVRARDQDLLGAASNLEKAHAANPTDVTIACNLIAVFIDLGDLTSALTTASLELAFADGSLRIARYRGFIAQSLGEFAHAVQAYEHVVKYAPDDFESWNNLGNARQPLGDFAGSIAALERAVALDPKAAPAQLNLASSLANAGRTDDANAILQRIIAAFPSDARPWHELYVNHKLTGLQTEALDALEKAVLLDPQSAMLQFKLAVEYGILMRPADAETAYQNALKSDPKLGDAYLGLAIQYEHSNREEKLVPLIKSAQENEVDSGVIAFLQALEYRRSGKLVEGLEAIAHIPPEIEPERTAHIKATLLDRLGHTDDAFAAFMQTAKLHQNNPGNPLERASQLRADVKNELKILSPEWAASWIKTAHDPDQVDPVFLVGFPRSGTTLLDTVLMGHDRVRVMEEKPYLNEVDADIGSLAALAKMDDTAVTAARAAYFEKVRIHEAWNGTDMLIDKSPLFLQKIPLINRVFPNARFILVLRHPCDVILSCFMSNFRLNSAMSNFLRLEDAVEFYDLIFQHWEKAGGLFPINMHTITYERLIENVETEVRPLFDFLGLDWQAGVLEHQKTAKARGLITTASYSQVTEPIYTRASGRWTRYRPYMEPVLPVLKPWIEKFGYSD